MEIVNVGEEGELHIGGICLARGYLNRPELTAERFITAALGNLQPTRLYKTGDLCRYLPDGSIEYLGRLDFQVKIRGFRIELGEIESVIKEEPSVKDCVVLARERATRPPGAGSWGDSPAAALAVSRDSPAEDSIQPPCRQRHVSRWRQPGRLEGFQGRSGCPGGSRRAESGSACPRRTRAGGVPLRAARRNVA